VGRGEKLLALTGIRRRWVGIDLSHGEKTQSMPEKSLPLSLTICQGLKNQCLKHMS
jgi:hypothetical protein